MKWDQILKNQKPVVWGGEENPGEVCHHRLDFWWQHQFDPPCISCHRCKNQGSERHVLIKVVWPFGYPDLEDPLRVFRPSSGECLLVSQQASLRYWSIGPPSTVRHIHSSLRALRSCLCLRLWLRVQCILLNWPLSVVSQFSLSICYLSPEEWLAFPRIVILSKPCWEGGTSVAVPCRWEIKALWRCLINLFYLLLLKYLLKTDCLWRDGSFGEGLPDHEGLSSDLCACNPRSGRHSGWVDLWRLMARQSAKCVRWAPSLVRDPSKK